MGIKKGEGRRTSSTRSTLSTSTCCRSSLRRRQRASHFEFTIRAIFAERASLARTYAGDKAWPLVLNDLDWFIARGEGKKMYFDEVRFFVAVCIWAC